MRILVCGGRDFKDRKSIKRVLRKFDDDTILIHGDARGADKLAGSYGRYRVWAIFSVPAQWKRYNRSAGYTRNARMLKEGVPELVIAFPGGRGTANMVKQARKKHITVKIVERGK